MATLPQSQSWADFVDEVAVVEDVQPQEDKSLFASVDTEASTEAPPSTECGPGDMNLLEWGPREGGVVTPTGDLSSVGSLHHRTGRCKPCAFFHTKGCQNDRDCLFCHLCPPGEKQRRKRLRERMCEKLGQCMQNPTPFNQVDCRPKSAHLRQGSGTSTGTSSTQSTCSGWSKFSHSRQSSASSAAHSTQEPGLVSPHMGGNSHMHQRMPAFHFAQQMTPPMAFCAEGGASQGAPANCGYTNAAAREEAGFPFSNAPSTTIALAQALPEKVNTNTNGWTSFNMAAGQQMPQAGAPGTPWQHTGVVQYALVPVPVAQMMQQQQNMAPPMSYACYTEQPYPQMAAVYGDNGQLCNQAEMQFAHPSFCPTMQFDTRERADTEALLDTMGCDQMSAVGTC